MQNTAPKSCCAPTRDGVVAALVSPVLGVADPHFWGARSAVKLCDISGGTALLGGNAPLLKDHGHSPQHNVKVAPVLDTLDSKHATAPGISSGVSNFERRADIGMSRRRMIR